MDETLAVQDFPGRTLRLLLFKDVTNSEELRGKVVAGTVEQELSFIDASAVVSVFQVALAAYRALESQSRGKLQSRTLHSELVFNLSGSKHISESLLRFGVSKETTSLLVGRFDGSDDDVELIKGLVKGVQIAVKDLESVADSTKIQKFAKVSQQELQLGTLEDAIVSRMAARDCT